MREQVIPGQGTGTQTRVAAPSGGQLGRIWNRFRHHRMAMAGGIGLLLVVSLVVLGSVLIPERQAMYNDLDSRLVGPSLAHPFGTDNTGRDMLARTIYGGQISLGIGILAAMLSVVMGLVIGAPAGYYGGWIDNSLMRVTEAMLCIPRLFLLMLLSKVIGVSVQSVTLLGHSVSASVLVIIAVIAATSWMSPARIIRGMVISLRSGEFVTAARCVGASDWRIITRHLLPNLVGPLTVAVTLGSAQSVLMEAYASFLGLGVQAPTPSWGNMLDRAVQYLQVAPWLWFFPGVLIVATVMCVNFLGDGLRDALDPRSRTAFSGK